MMNKRYMKARNFIRADDDWGWIPVPGTITVHEDVYEPYDTGLLDSDGDALIAYPEPKKIGFLHWEE